MIKQAYYLPHGMEIIPGTKESSSHGFEGLHKQMMEVAQIANNDGCDVYILITPHGYSMETQFTLYEHERYQGFVYRLADDSVVYGDQIAQLEFSGDQDLNDTLKNILEIPLVSLVHGISDYPLTVNWGTLVPFYYVQKHQSPPVSILALPRTRHTDWEGLQIHLDQLATDLVSLQNLDRSIGIIISGDLSHVHQQSGPYGYHDSAVPFDELVMEWIKSPNEQIIDQLLDLQSDALACGMAGLYLLQKIFEFDQISYELDTNYYAVPSYFGMGIGVWNIP